MACAGGITSMVMSAAGSFITNGGLTEVFGAAPLQAAAPLTTAASSLGNQSWFSELSSTVSGFKDSVLNFTTGMNQAWNLAQTEVANGVTSMLGNFAPNAAQALSGQVLQTTQMAFNYGLDWASKTVGGPGISTLVGDAQRFGSILTTAQSYIGTANQFVGAASNASNYLEGTFRGMDNLITGGIDGISKWAQGLGGDMSELGATINFEKLDKLGSPGQLLENMANQGSLGSLAEKISNITLSESTVKALGGNVLTAAQLTLQGRPVTLSSVGLDVNKVVSLGAGIPGALQSDIYKVMSGVTGNELRQVQQILGNKQSNITTMADLLDPKKLLPNAFTTLTTPKKTASVGFRAIYEDETGSVNSELDNLGSDLKGIIPDDQAVANAALARSLLQVKNIAKTNATELSNALTVLESNKDLPLVASQTSPVPPGVSEYWQSQYASSGNISLGTGTGGQLKLSDVIGFAAGNNSAEAYAKTSDITAKLASLGALDRFTKDGGPSSSSTGMYKVIQYFIEGTYGPFEVIIPSTGESAWELTIPPGVKGAGKWEGADPNSVFQDAWINGIVPASVAQCQALYNEYPEECQQLNDLNAQFTEQLAREYINQQRARNTVDPVDLTDTPKTNTAALQLATNLHTYGRDTSDGGTAQILESIANLDSYGGQTMIAAMREGRNIKRLEDAGLSQDTSLNDTLPEQPATLLPSQYTKAEAEEQIIRS